MRYVFSIDGTLPSLNEYMDAANANRYAAAHMKRDAQARIRAALIDPPRFKGAVTVEIAWHCPNIRKDKDNVAFAKKFILDALQEAGVIENDSWKLCTPYDVGFNVNRENPHIVVCVEGEA